MYKIENFASSQFYQLESNFVVVKNTIDCSRIDPVEHKSLCRLVHVYSPLPLPEFSSPEKNEEFQILKLCCKDADVVWLKLCFTSFSDSNRG